MLIDDNELDNFVNKKLLENEHFAEHVLVQSSGNNALDYLKSHANNAAEIPEIIFLDIMMPDLDGFGFLIEFEKLNDEIKNKSKVIMLSTSESFKDLNRANRNKYVYKFLNKPLNKPVLDALNVWFSINELRIYESTVLGNFRFDSLKTKPITLNFQSEDHTKSINAIVPPSSYYQITKSSNQNVCLMLLVHINSNIRTNS